MTIKIQKKIFNNKFRKMIDKKKSKNKKPLSKFLKRASK